MKLSLISIGLCAVAGVLAQSGNELGDIFNGIRSHPDGLVKAGEDGILRSFDGEGRVIDFVRLDSGHLMTLAGLFGGQKKELINIWQNVNSSEVTEDQIWSPPSNMLPAKSSDPEQTPVHQNDLRAERDCPEYHCPNTAYCRRVGCMLCAQPPYVPSYAQSHCLGIE